VRSTGGRFGPARARNVGARAASGEIVVFLDADVCVSPDTISKIVTEFTQDPELDAVMGSYDESPAAQNFMSQFRNLMHSYVHRHANREAVTFWTGCGAIRRQVFLDSGGFAENHSPAPAIEDIELGYRLSQANRKLALNADIQVKHLKHWNFRSMIAADFFRRAIPWSDLILRSGRMPNDLNVRISQRISVVLALMLLFLAVYQAVRWHVPFLPPHLPWLRLQFVFLALLVTLVALNSQFYVFLASAKGRLFALAAIPLHLLYFVNSGVAFMVALVRYSFGKLRNPRDAVTVATPRPEEAKAKAIAP
jgi:cellulose synthase/poly-beta-1,6-N-acetylglucosamine synthase-like glycosyltransferase